MPSKLTQAEKQRREAVREALRVIRERKDYALNRSETVARQSESWRADHIAAWITAEMFVRALLAPKRKKRGKGDK